MPGIARGGLLYQIMEGGMNPTLNAGLFLSGTRGRFPSRKGNEFVNPMRSAPLGKDDPNSEKNFNSPSDTDCGDDCFDHPSSHLKATVIRR
jgi:hypothetical protein